MADDVRLCGGRDPREWHRGFCPLGLYVGAGRCGVDPARWAVRVGDGAVEVVAFGRYVGVWWPPRWPLNWK